MIVHFTLRYAILCKVTFATIEVHSYLGTKNIAWNVASYIIYLTYVIAYTKIGKSLLLMVLFLTTYCVTKKWLF